MCLTSYRVMKKADVTLLTLALLFARKSLHGALQNQHGTFFQLIKDEGEEKTQIHDPMSVIHESFHKCDSDAACNYVLEDIKRKEYSMIEEEKDLPAEGRDMRTWEKVACAPDPKSKLS